MSVPVLPTISTSCIVISAIFVAIGWNLIRKKKNRSTYEIYDNCCYFAVVFFLFTHQELFLLETLHLVAQII